MNTSWRIGFGVVAAFLAGESSAQTLACTASDVSCFQRELDKACRSVGATVTSCLEWLDILERSSLSKHPNLRISAVDANLILNELTGGRGSKTKYLDRAEQILDELIIDDPTNITALYALSAMREKKEERVELLRRVVDLDPTFIPGWESLAVTVSRGGARADLQESAELLEQAYVVSPAGAKKWHLAGDAIMQYENAQSTIDAERLRERASADYGLETLLTLASKPETAGPEALNAALEELCSPTGIVIFGANHCLENIQRVVDVANVAHDTSVGAAYAESATMAMRNASVSHRLKSADPDWRARFEKTLDGFLKSRTASAGMFVAYADITTDREKRLQVMETAAARFPSDGDIAIRLGIAYIDQGRKEDGVRALTHAKDLLPPTNHMIIDQALKKAGVNALDRGAAAISENQATE